jgi:uncharacterized protein (DUF58 family)
MWWRRLLDLGRDTSADEADLALPPELLELLERLRLLAVRAAGGGLKEGHRLGAYRGGQLEFHDYRAYTPGDDLRYLDWNLLARLGRPFVKEFAREEAGTVYLLLDATPSMGLGVPPKYTFARRLAALFAHVGWSAHDTVHACVFRGAGRALNVYPARGARGDTPGFLQWLRKQPLAEPDLSAAPRVTEANSAAGPAAEGVPAAAPAEGALQGAVREFLRLAPPRGRVFILSDFWQEEDGISQALQRLSGAGFELSAIHVLSAAELTPPEPGDWRFYATEESGDVEVSVTPATTTRYAAELEAHRAMVEGLVRRRGGVYLFERSDTPLERVLIQALRRRRWVG